MTRKTRPYTTGGRPGQLRARIPARLAACLVLPVLSAMSIPPAPVAAQTAAGGVQAGTLGIDCDSPRRGPDGALLPVDGPRRAICEADRATALTYAGAVRETRDRLRAALGALPAPLWEDLVEHLRTDDGIAGWTHSDPDVMSSLQALSAAAPPGDPARIATAARAHGLAEHWNGGILGRGGVPPAWRGSLRARACGFDAAGGILPGAVILVWLDPGAVRERWTPRMVQRAARAWLERTGDRAAAVDGVPGVVTAGGGLSGPDGRVRALSADPATLACLSTVPAGALAMAVRLRRAVETGGRAARCAGPDTVGVRRFAWARHNGVFTVPRDAVLDSGTARPDRGAPLLGQVSGLPLAVAEPGASDPPGTPPEFLVSSTCRAPRTLDAVRAFPCDAEINGVAVRGTHVRRFRFREVQADPDDPFRIDWAPVGPGNGELGVIAPPGAPHPVWETVTLFCGGALPPSDAPVVPPPVEVPDGDPDWTVPDCAAQWGGRFDRGDRRGYRQNFRYPDGWPVDDEEIRTIDDDCFNPVRATGSVERPGPDCPEGHIGAITEARDFSWWNRDWAVPARHAGGAEGDRTAAQAAAIDWGLTASTIRSQSAPSCSLSAAMTP